MLTAFLHWLDHVALVALFASITMLVIVNGAFAAGVIVRRDRALVNRWTSRVLAVDLALIGVALGAPAVAASARFAARTIGPAVQAELRSPGFFAPPPSAPGARPLAE